MVGALVFSGGLSVVVIPALDYMQVGESYDMIIGVDGSRVTNFLDFQDRMRDLQPGEIVYLSIVRDGKRVQVTMPVPTDSNHRCRSDHQLHWLRHPLRAHPLSLYS